MPLTEHLHTGGYEGLEIVAASVEWCQRHITPAFPHFRFRHADVFNSMYNPAGRHRPRAYRFPYPDGAFDLAFLTSVFTHLLPADVEVYVRELSRVLKPGGRCFATFYLIDPPTLSAITAGGGRLRFPFRYGVGERGDAPVEYGGCYLEQVDVPEAVVAYERRWVMDLFTDHGFAAPVVTEGRWSGRPDGDDFQDIVLATKVGRVSVGRRLRSVARLTPLREFLWRRRRV